MRKTIKYLYYILSDTLEATLRSCPYTLEGGEPRIRLHIALLANWIF